MKLLGLDYGSSWIGVAIGYTENKVAAPIEVWHGLSVEQLLDKTAELVKDDGIDEVVVGWPLTGAPNHVQAQSCQRVAEALAGRLNIPVRLQDEGYSSQEASRRLGPGNKTNDGHAVAAMLILEGYMSHL